jgi:thiol-disulfide isomerase/thioredoxin
MKKTFFAVLIALFCLPVVNGYPADITPEKGSAFPDISLPIPGNDAQAAYLGLSGKGMFRISQIKADVVIIEIFSMYCPYCQKEAPLVNDLYKAIGKNPGLKEKIKIIGIGAGNTAFEIDIFREKYSIPFPLFTDDSFVVHKKVGEVRTPYFFVLKMNADGSNRIIYSKVGTIQDPAQFLNLIVDEAGLK